MSRPVRKASRSAQPAVVALEGRQLLAFTPLHLASNSAAMMMSNLQAAAARATPSVVEVQATGSKAGVTQATSQSGSPANEFMANLAAARAVTPSVVVANPTPTHGKGLTSLSKRALLPSSQPVSHPSVIVSSAAPSQTSVAGLLGRNLAARSSGVASPVVVHNDYATVSHAAPVATAIPTKKG